MVNAIINGISVSVPRGTTIMEAAAQVGIEIPHLCFLKEINEIGACRLCIVEVEGHERLVPSCDSKVTEGMVVYTNSPKVRHDRRKTVQLMLSQHDCKCATCARSGNCSLQTLANDLNILHNPYEEMIERQAWDMKFPLIRDSAKCIKCLRCINICDKVQGLGIWQLESTGTISTVNVSGGRKITEADCALCGQCITHCPVGALRERDDTEQVFSALADPTKTVVFQVAPAVRTAWGEALGLRREEATMGRMAAALRRLGFDHVFDTNFTADRTIMEEGTEFLHRLTSGGLTRWPMFTSCCPGWVRFLKSQYPELTRQLSTAKSPQQMFGALMKTYFAQKEGIDPSDIVFVSAIPCTAKKFEVVKVEREFGIINCLGC